MSNEVKRYRIKQANWAYMQQSDDGDYVRYDNYAALEAECERLCSALRKVLATHDYHTDDGEHAADEAHAVLAEVK